MSSIAKFTTALGSISNEVTVTAANFNLDFTLMKVEAPAEYQPLGLALSGQRRQQAESGAAHTTARKLGALFEHIIPHTPKLFAVYGRRASEIIQKTAPNSSNDQLNNIGPFSNHAGPDATSIWAAATSGKRSISMHLLACMLARIWKGPEATSVWVELVARRKAQVLDEFDQSSIQATADLMATQQEITRAHLATWDSSARAWLQTADEAFLLKQTQLKLVLDNINIPVDSQGDLYQSVIFAWTNALLMVDRLAAGTPQSVQDGSVLLGLSAWHLYPDMLVLGQATTQIEQKDELIQLGGILTIGLQHSDRNDLGIFWSLPLAHMHYYGHIPTITRSLATSTSRVSVEQLYQVALGNLSAQWAVDLPQLTYLLLALRNCMSTYESEAETKTLPYWSLRPYEWFGEISKAATMSIDSHGRGQEVYTKLHALGSRRKGTFLNQGTGSTEHSFGLSNFANLMPLFKDEEEQINFLRHIGEGFGLNPDDFFIRYLPLDNIAGRRWEYASVTAHSFQSLKRSHDGRLQTVQAHCRWISPPNSIAAEVHQYSKWDKTEEEEEYFDSILNMDTPRKPEVTDPVTSKARNLEPEWEFKGRTGSKVTKATVKHREKCLFFSRRSFIRRKDDYSFIWVGFGLDRSTIDEDEPSISLSTKKDEADKEWCVQWDEEIGEYQPYASASVEDEVEFEFLLGDLNSAAIFMKRGLKPVRHVAYGYGGRATMQEITTALKMEHIDSLKLNQYLCRTQDREISNAPDSNLTSSLRTLSLMKKVYDGLSYAMVDVSVIGRPIYQACWIKELTNRDSSRNPIPNLQETFSCIAMFESGSFDIDPSHLKGVVALSAGNSLFIASCLLEGPPLNASGRVSSNVERVLGNIGRAEMAFLIAPSTPPAQKVFDYSQWDLITHADFDGTCQDCFQNTTLHLSFTDYEQPVDVGTRGIKDTEVVLLESVVSVHDRGKWISDIDVVSMFASKLLLDATLQSCQHDPAQRGYSPNLYENTLQSKVLAIDNWEELLDSPQAITIVRAHGNWLARLAATAISIQNGRKTAVLSSDVCWKCLCSCSIWAEEVSLIC